MPIYTCFRIAFYHQANRKRASREVLHYSNQQALFAQLAMASCQCSKPVEPPCNQDQKNHSSGQKVEKQAQGGVVKTGTHSSSQTLSPGSTNGMTPAPACNARTDKRGERKRSLLQRIKDGISGHSDGGGGSSSDSESDDEKCGQRKN